MMRGFRKGMVAVCAAAVLLAGGVIGVLAQEDAGGRGQRGQRGGDAGGVGQRGGDMMGGFDMEAMQQRMEERVREQLGASEEDWQIIGPRYRAVQEKQTAMTMASIGGMFGRGGRGGGDFGGARRGGFEMPGMTVMPETEKLQQVLDNEESTPEEIKTALEAYRQAMEKQREELKKAREELRAVLSIRQEAILTIAGTLE